jgi:hypothetical protein
VGGWQLAASNPPWDRPTNSARSTPSPSRTPEAPERVPGRPPGPAPEIPNLRPLGWGPIGNRAAWENAPRDTGLIPAGADPSPHPAP